MPYRITFALDLFRGNSERKLSRATLNVLLDALFKMDVLYLQAHPETPLLYRSGVRYMEEPPGMEDWNDIPTVLRLGVSDCEDLAAWRAAELVVRFGIPAIPFFREQRRQDGGFLYHILVAWWDARARRWRVEDPSRILGMR